MALCANKRSWTVLIFLHRHYACKVACHSAATNLMPRLPTIPCLS